MTESRFEATRRLAERVLNGEVVFFVGSGFSIDSEKNTAARLVARLLAGLLAMATIVSEAREGQGQARTLLEGMARVFNLEGGVQREPARCMTEANVQRLAREYYTFNEWAASAMGALATEFLALPEARRDDIAARIQQLGNFLLGFVNDVAPFGRLDWVALQGFENEAALGKAVFLDTMGFADPEVMAGDPETLDVAAVVESYRARIRPRHEALARIAREGLSDALVTTNYDLLLEGAYRLAGFFERSATVALPDGVTSASIPRYSCIAGAGDYFARGEGYRTALLLKIHGSAHSYRRVRQAHMNAAATFRQAHMADGGQMGEGAKPNAPSARGWAEYLPAMVFTYREIQTWRADAWSRDLIRTYLRTHTLALCGYSAADPVLHSTFREVYEERARARGASPPPKDRAPKHAPLFFFSLAGRREFHSLEVLRAATEAGGYDAVQLGEHPNMVEFVPEPDFPTLDDQFRWLVHCVLRGAQTEALDTRLRRVVHRLLGRPCADAEFTAIKNRFKLRVDTERACVTRLGDPARTDPAAERRRQFDRITGWTWSFLPGLLRELALAEQAEGARGARLRVRIRRSLPWYEPASERPEWTAWAAIVELALRSMVAAWRGSVADGSEADDVYLVPEDSPYAAISFSRGKQQRQPSAICIRLGGFERPEQAAPIPGAFRRITYWELSEQDVPWTIDASVACPSAHALWGWATGRIFSQAQAAEHLGVPA